MTTDGRKRPDALLPEDAEAVVREYGSVRAAVKATGIARTTLRDKLAAAKRRAAAVRGEVGAPPIPEIAKPPEGFVIRRNSGQYDAEGNLERQWIESGQGNADGYEIPEGHTVKGESTLLDANGHVLAKWIKTREDKSGVLIDALREAFAGYVGAAPEVPAPALADDDLLTVYPIPDLHLGMHAWGRETGDNYDVKIAVAMATEIVGRLVARSEPSRRAVLLGLGDYFHANDAKAVTPQSGNRLDVDGRWMKVYGAGARLAIAMVDLIGRKHQEIEVVFLRGNHDPDAAGTLSVALDLFYSANPRISVHDGPGIAWYRRHGKTLLGATHGHTMKGDRMAMMMAADRPEEWGQARHCYFYSGHVHHVVAQEFGRVIVESFGSPAARDAFNADGGYRAQRSLSAITHHVEHGEIGRHRINIMSGEGALQAAPSRRQSGA